MSHTLTEADEFTANIVVPDPGDDRKAASVETPFQGLANRTKNLKGRIDNYEGDSHTWGDTQFFEASPRLRSGGLPTEIEYDEGTRTRIILLPMKPHIVPAGWTSNASSMVWYTDGANPLGFFIGNDVLPTEAVLTRVRAGASFGSAGISATLDVARMQPGMTPPLFQYIENGPVLSDSYTAAGNETHILDVTTGFEGRNYNYLHRIRLTKTGGSGGNFGLVWIELTVEDPGPRNF